MNRQDAKSAKQHNSYGKHPLPTWNSFEISTCATLAQTGVASDKKLV
jgi:hypothetical protein